MSYNNHIIEKLTYLENSIFEDIISIMEDSEMEEKVFSKKFLTFLFSFISKYVYSFINSESQQSVKLSINVYLNVIKRVFKQQERSEQFISLKTLFYFSTICMRPQLQAYYLPRVVVYNFSYLSVLKSYINKI